MTKPRDTNVSFEYESNGLKLQRLQALVCTVVVCMSATVPQFVHADTPHTSSHIQVQGPGAQLYPPNVVPISTVKPSLPAPPKSRGTARKVAAAPGRGFDRNAVLSRTLTRGQFLVRTALGYRGLPYRWGGTSPRSGFDCSGLVQTVYAKWGIYLPRCAHEQVAKGVPIPKDKLQAGDLVFFKNTYKRGLSHVGIYVGDDWFIHAASHRTGVVLSRLDARYNRNHWYGARRLNLSKLPPVPGEAYSPERQRVILDKTETVDTDLLASPDDPPPSELGR